MTFNLLTEQSSDPNSILPLYFSLFRTRANVDDFPVVNMDDKERGELLRHGFKEGFFEGVNMYPAPTITAISDDNKGVTMFNAAVNAKNIFAHGTHKSRLYNPADVPFSKGGYKPPFFKTDNENGTPINMVTLKKDVFLPYRAYTGVNSVPKKLFDVDRVDMRQVRLFRSSGGRNDVFRPTLPGYF